jgi:hypothetical protein
MNVVNCMQTVVVGFVCSASLVCAGCSALREDYTTFRAPIENDEVTISVWMPSDVYGSEDDVRGTVELVKTIGNISEIGSHAIRLPSRPMHAVTTFDYEFPDACGGHHFRVYESDGIQILEYAYVPSDGKPYVIRDYVTGPSPFIQAGLWTAYDHTGENVSEMRVQFAKRGSGILAGTYSQGLVTGLDVSSRRVLGTAYDRALRDTYACRS